MYELLVGQGTIQPGEFWRLRPVEAWWILIARIPEQTAAKAETRERLKALYDKAKAEEANGKR